MLKNRRLTISPNSENNSLRTKIILVVIGLVILSVLAGWLIGRSNKSTTTNSSNTTTQARSSNSASGADVKSLVSYTLPDAWSENTCSGSKGTVYIIPNGTSLNCSANPSAPIKAYVDSQSTTDCQQLMPANGQGIKKHVCISLYIGGHKSLKASTTYSSGSSYRTDTTISDYFINTGKGVVAIEYTYTSTNDFQAGFDQLATSVKVKG